MESFCRLSVVASIVCTASLSWSQISPPGLGKANSASWFAVGIRQEMDTVEGSGWQSMTYVGVGRKSTPTSINPLQKSAILVLNQEFYHQFHKNWQYSVALSYRRQDEYQKDAPFYHDRPNIEQEFRLYGRIAHTFKFNRVKLVPTLRQEIRKFYTPDFKNPEEALQLRTRFRLQLKVNLDKSKQHRLIIGSEQLFATSRDFDSWSNFTYKESRFTLYYSLSPKNIPLIFNLGYMADLIGYQHPYNVNYVAFDVIIENPFKLKKRLKENIYENYE